MPSLSLLLPSTFPRWFTHPLSCEIVSGPKCICTSVLMPPAWQSEHPPHLTRPELPSRPSPPFQRWVPRLSTMPRVLLGKELIVSDAKKLNLLNICKKIDLLFFRKIIFLRKICLNSLILYSLIERVIFWLERIWQENIMKVDDLLSRILTGEFQFKAGNRIHFDEWFWQGIHFDYKLERCW